MNKSILNLVKQFFSDPRYIKVRAVFWFCVITLLIHILWRFWEYNLLYFPIRNLMAQATVFFVDLLFNQSVWVITHILQIKISTVSNAFYCQNNYGIILNETCSGIKQIMQFALLMLIIPGPWKHKLWNIPLGMILVHLTNVFRISILAIVANRWPTQIHYAHDNWLRIMFYVVIFLLWLIWVEWIANKKINQKDAK